MRPQYSNYLLALPCTSVRVHMSYRSVRVHLYVYVCTCTSVRVYLYVYKWYEYLESGLSEDVIAAVLSNFHNGMSKQFSLLDQPDAAE